MDVAGRDDERPLRLREAGVAVSALNPHAPQLMCRAWALRFSSGPRAMTGGASSRVETRFRGPRWSRTRRRAP